MRLFGRKKPAAGGDRHSTKADVGHLEEFVRTRRGVEAFVEPKTTVTEMTVVLVAADGEWTRRRVSDPAQVRKLGAKLAIPVYDVAAVGYPQRMRDYTHRRKAAGDTGVPGLDGPSV